MSTSAPHAGRRPTISSTVHDQLQKAGLDARSPYCAYALSATFAVCAPFSFATGAAARASLASRSYTGASASSATAAAATSRATNAVSQALSAAASTKASSASTSSAMSSVPAWLQRAAARAAPSGFRGLPPFWQLAGFSAVFAGGGYMIQAGDPVNGSGTVTAWSLTYLFFHGVSGLRRTAPSAVGATAIARPLALLLVLNTLTAGLLVHGSFYADRYSRRSASSGYKT